MAAGLGSAELSLANCWYWTTATAKSTPQITGQARNRAPAASRWSAVRASTFTVPSAVLSVFPCKAFAL